MYLSEAADKFGIGLVALSNAVLVGKVRAMREYGTGGLWKVTPAAVESAIERGDVAPATKREDKIMKAYCIGCKVPVETEVEESVVMKNGRPAHIGKCPKCGRKVLRIGNLPSEK
jgi:hypothetical protein